MLPYYDSLSVEKRKLISDHLDHVMKANEEINLTRIVDEQSGMLLHVEDSLSAIPEMNEAPNGLYGDLGSGAGFPGIPLAVATGRNTTLVDARMKKMMVVQSIIEELNMSDQVKVYAGRAELLARKNPACFSVITARALSNLSTLLELGSPLLVKGGHLICYKANLEEDELDNALGIQSLVGMKLISDRSFKLNDEFNRRILVFERSGKCKVKLPRQEGLAQKSPLVEK